MEVRTRIIYEAVKNYNKYVDDFYVSRGAINFYDRGTLPQQYGQYSENYNPYVEFNLKGLYEQEVLDICKDSTFCGIWQADLSSMQCDTLSYSVNSSKNRKSQH